VDPDVVVAARKIAKEMGISISALIEGYLRKLTVSNENPEYNASEFLEQIPAKEPSFPYDNKSDDQWLGETLDN